MLLLLNYLIWISFIISLTGMIIVKFTSNAKANQLLLNLCFQFEVSSQAGNNKINTLRFFEELAKHYVLNSKLKISKLKISYIAFFSASLGPIGMIMAHNTQPLVAKPIWVLMIAATSFPVHWIIDYLFNIGFYKTYIKNKNRSFLVIAIYSFWSGLWRVLTFIIIIFFLTIFLFLKANNIQITPFEVAPNIAQMIAIVVSIFVIVLTAMSVIVSGAALLLLSAFQISDIGLAAGIGLFLFALASILTSGFLATILLASAAIVKSKKTLRFLAGLSAYLHIAGKNPERFNNYLTLFTIATGLMQAVSWRLE